jgi:hypothetical protein
MLCSEGMGLFQRFQSAVEEGHQEQSDPASAVENRTSGQQPTSANMLYSRPFLAWVAHRTFCAECRSMASSRDMMNLVSLRQNA